MNDLIERVEKCVFAKDLLQPGQSVLVAVSGGLDSMALLSALHTLAPKFGWRVSAAHFNHGLRGAESDGEAALVRREAARLGLPFFGGAGEVRGFAASEGVSVEMAARELRHRFLAETAANLRIPTVALAHHADDQIETFLLRLLRGAGGSGLGGMKWKSPSPANPEIELVRPFLGLPKKQIAGFAASQEMAFREDSSNEDTHVPRNFLRHAVLPVLARFPGGGGVANIPRAMDLIGAEADFVEGCARAWLAGERSKPFADLHPALRRKIAHLQLVEAGLAPSFDLVEALTQKLDEPVNIDPARAARIDSGGRLHLFPSGLPGFNPERHPTILDSPEGQVRLGEACLAWRFLGQVPEEFPPGAECFDAATIGDRIVVRHWQPGDRFQPIGMPSPVKLQNLFVNAGISRAERRELPVAEDTLGRIFWVRGLRMSELHKVTPRTARCLQFRFGPSQAPAP